MYSCYEGLFWKVDLFPSFVLISVPNSCLRYTTCTCCPVLSQKVHALVALFSRMNYAFVLVSSDLWAPIKPEEASSEKSKAENHPADHW